MSYLMLTTFLILIFPISDARFLLLPPLLPHCREETGFVQKPSPQHPVLDMPTTRLGTNIITWYWSSSWASNTGRWPDLNLRIYISHVMTLGWWMICPSQMLEQVKKIQMVEEHRTLFHLLYLDEDTSWRACVSFIPTWGHVLLGLLGP